MLAGDSSCQENTAANDDKEANVKKSYGFGDTFGEVHEIADQEIAFRRNGLKVGAVVHEIRFHNHYGDDKESPTEPLSARKDVRQCDNHGHSDIACPKHPVAHGPECGSGAPVDYEPKLQGDGSESERACGRTP